MIKSDIAGIGKEQKATKINCIKLDLSRNEKFDMRRKVLPENCSLSLRSFVQKLTIAMLLLSFEIMAS